MPTPQEGREALDQALLREVDEALQDFLRAIAKAKNGIAEAEHAIAHGQAISTSVTGDAFVVPDNLNALGTAYAAAERRRIRLLRLYDETNGTVAP